MKTLRQVGEWGWLKRMLPTLPGARSSLVQVGPGDDAAVLRPSSEEWVWTTDMLVEDVHFRRRWTGGEELGHKALAVNLSDLAAMGAVRPRVALVSAALPAETSLAYLKGIYRGLNGMARRWGVAILGGDTVRGPSLVLSLTLGGTLAPGARPLRRSGAQPGDVLVVSGCLGDAAAGLALAEGQGTCRGRDRGFLLQRLKRPEPQLKTSDRWGREPGVHALMDISDGLARSLQLMAEASRVTLGVQGEKLPLSPAFRRWATIAGWEPEMFALEGGEDYELLAAMSPKAFAHCSQKGGAFVVGEVRRGRAQVTLSLHGRPRKVPHDFKHFR